MSEGNHLMQRLVGENVKLRRKIDAVQEDNKNTRRLRDLLKLEEAKVGRLRVALQKSQDKVKRLQAGAAERDKSSRKNYKLRRSLMRRVEKLENKLRYEESRGASRREQILRVIKVLRGML